MLPVTAIIPNYKGELYLEKCIRSLMASEKEAFPVIVVDDNSGDDTADKVKEKYPAITLLKNRENKGFAFSVNRGIRFARTPYVILLNNDTQVRPEFVTHLYEEIKDNNRYFSAQAKLVTLADPHITDSAGDFYSVLGWARARGNGKPQSSYHESCNIFSACAGAAIYRRDVLLNLGLFDEDHFAYLEDVDIGYRAKLKGYINRFCPKAIVRHAGSAVSGSKHNAFKVELSAGNSMYLAYKNMPLLQLLINLPFLFLGHMIKLLYFTEKGLLKAYLKGILRGIKLISSYKKKREFFRNVRFSRILEIQLELILNLLTMT